MLAITLPLIEVVIAFVVLGLIAALASTAGRIALLAVAVLLLGLTFGFVHLQGGL
ncbi:MAG: hypothetical protein JRN07_05045 [Nitrososphaerota archaeon]|nr:hypothetical protein [Nitrososphaerota archaeon]